MTIIKKFLENNGIPFTYLENQNEYYLRAVVADETFIYKQDKYYNSKTYTKIGTFEATQQSQKHVVKRLERLLKGDKSDCFTF